MHGVIMLKMSVCAGRHAAVFMSMGPGRVNIHALLPSGCVSKALPPQSTTIRVYSFGSKPCHLARGQNHSECRHNLTAMGFSVLCFSVQACIFLYPELLCHNKKAISGKAQLWQNSRFSTTLRLMSNLRDNIKIVLVNTRFPENIGMVARACGNMGISRMAVVMPELWPQVWPLQEGEDCPGAIYAEKALTVATSAGRETVKNLQAHACLDDALAECTLSFGSTARTGGWRQQVLNPEEAAALTKAHLQEGGNVSFVFGPEDKGLDNEAIEKCSHLINIPTASEPSLNLAQAALLVMYELGRAMPFGAASKTARAGRMRHSPFITHEQSRLLLEKIKEAMLVLESLPSGNSGYFMLPLRRLTARMQLRHNEYSMLMGVCSGILRLAEKNPPKL